jgi:hypothetical protein
MGRLFVRHEIKVAQMFELVKDDFPGKFGYIKKGTVAVTRQEGRLPKPAKSAGFAMTGYKKPSCHAIC